MENESCDFYRQAALLYAHDVRLTSSTNYFSLSEPNGSVFISASATTPESTVSSKRTKSEFLGSLNPKIELENPKSSCTKSFDDSCLSLKCAEESCDLSRIRKEYIAFLVAYPLCFGYWRRLAHLEMKLGKSFKAADEILVRGLQVNPYSVDLWTARIEFYQKEGKQVSELHESDKEDQASAHMQSMQTNIYTENHLRSIFNSGLEKIGAEWASSAYWKLFINWEIKNANWGQVGRLYHDLFCNGLIIGDLQQIMEEFHEFLANFKYNFAELVHPKEKDDYDAMIQEFEAKEAIIASERERVRDEQASERERRLRALAKQFDVKKQRMLERDFSRHKTPEEVMMKLNIEHQLNKEALIKELDEKAVRNQKNEKADKQGRLICQQKDILLKEREIGFRMSMNLVEKRKGFESTIRRLHYHPKPLDESQLAAWRNYLGFEILESKSFPERVQRLFRRCLIACNDYVEFWIRYIDWLVDVKDIKEARQVLQQARTIYLVDSTSLWIKSAEIEECADTIEGSSNDCYEKARFFLIEIDRIKNWADSEVLLCRICFERRHQRLDRCSELFKSAFSPDLSNQPSGLDNSVDNHTEEPEWRENLPANARTKIAIFYAYFLVDVYGNFKLAREILKSARELRCARQSVLLASIDIEARIEVLKRGIQKVENDENEDGYIVRVSQLYDELLREASLLNQELVSALWHHYITFLYTNGESMQVIRTVKMRALASLSEFMK